MPIDLGRLTSIPQITLLGRPVTIQRSGYPTASIGGIYDSRSFEMGDIGQMGGTAIETTVAFRRADLEIRGFGLACEDAAVRESLTIIVDGRAYRPTDAQPDSEGMVVFRLERAPHA